MGDEGEFPSLIISLDDGALLSPHPGHHQGDFAEEQSPAGQDTRHQGQRRRGRGAVHEWHNDGGLDTRV